MYWYQYLAQNNDWLWLFSVNRTPRGQNAHKKTNQSFEFAPSSATSTIPVRRTSRYVKCHGTLHKWNSLNLSRSFRTPRSSKVKMNSDQYIVTVFSFKKSKNSKVVPDMESSFNSSVSTNYGPPLDYSFRNISSLEKLERHRPPRQSLRKQVIHWS